MLMRLCARWRGFRMGRHSPPIFAVVLASSALGACRQPIETGHGAAWDRYVKADSAYKACRAQVRTSPSCLNDYAARQTALEAYRTEAGRSPPPGR